MKIKRVLVLLSSYNGEKYIAQQIESILNQKTQHSVNLLIRDDGSDDNTVEIIKYYTKKNSERITFLSEQNIGYIASFFKLIKIANGYDYYSLSDQDDVWLDNKIDIAIEWLEKENQCIPLLYGASSFLVYDDLKPYGTTQKKNKEITFFNTIIQNFLPGHEQVMNQLLLNELKNPIETLTIYVHDSWITNVAMVKGKVLFNNESFVLYRQHKANEVGYGKGKIGWIKERIKRIRNKDNKKYAIQIYEFVNLYNDFLTDNQKIEMKNFFENSNFAERFLYIFKTKLFRQTHFQTFLFKCLYLFNGYKL